MVNCFWALTGFLHLLQTVSKVLERGAESLLFAFILIRTLQVVDSTEFAEGIFQ